MLENLEFKYLGNYPDGADPTKVKMKIMDPENGKLINSLRDTYSPTWFSKQVWHPSNNFWLNTSNQS
ncbi:hypothetical protein O6P43_020960 [Quillaja saponaria]|uniref:Uncharacterized protein n=1 Tax=Quillaja saponaria TaxID=32244 RepID=A0AAD7LM41_QUISA|nr:hypothetical protein O6P43_020960 [Quillaja saponaria]